MELHKIRQRLSMGESIYDLPLKVTFYGRVSTDKDAQLNSLDNQISYFQDFIQNNENWTYIDGYIDEGISGTSVNKRDGFLKMISDAKLGKFDLILTKEISRFSRSTLDSIKYTQELLSYDVGVLFQSDNINTIMPDSELRLTIMSSIAQEEVRKLSDRVKFGFKRSQEKGRVLGNSAIIGYKKCDGKLIIDEEEAKIIKLIFEKYSTGDYGLQSLSRYLYENGYKSKTGKMYANSTIRCIIRNPKYIGFFCYNRIKTVDPRTKKRIIMKHKDWIVYDSKGVIPKIVTPELWEKCNKILEERTCGYLKKQSGKDAFKRRTTYSGLLHCSEHNTTFIRHTDSRSKRHVWICGIQAKHGVKECKSPIIYEEELEKICLNIIQKILKERESIINDLYKLYKENSISRNYKNEINKIIKQKELVYLKKEKLMDLLLSGEVKAKDYDLKNNALDKEIENLENKIYELKISEEKYKKLQDSFDEIQKTIKNEIYSKETYPKFVQMFISKIMVSKINGNRYHLKLDFFIDVLGKELSVEYNPKKNLPLCNYQENNNNVISGRRKSY